LGRRGNYYCISRLWAQWVMRTSPLNVLTRRRPFPPLPSSASKDRRPELRSVNGRSDFKSPLNESNETLPAAAAGSCRSTLPLNVVMSIDCLSCQFTSFKRTRDENVWIL